MVTRRSKKFFLSNSADASLMMLQAVVNTFGNGSVNSTTSQAVRAEFAAAQRRTVNSQVVTANGDSINSIYHIGNIPSDAMIDPDAKVVAGVNGGLTSVSVGISGSGGQAVAAGVANCLVNAQNWSAGGTFSLTGNISVANQQQRAWQFAGLASDPGGLLEVYATLNAASTAAINLNFFLHWLKA